MELNEYKGRMVVVYCSSRSDLAEDVVNGAREISSIIGQCGAMLVYGGVDAGLMHEVAEAAHQSGAPICGVIPEVFSHRADALLDIVVKTKNLNERKGRMIEQGDVFIVLPGGLGTIDEWISTLSDIIVREKVDSEANRPILVWNHNGMYEGIVSQLRQTAESVYARGKGVDRSVIFDDWDELANSLKRLLTE
ncbi:MAG: LOG family protein [Prevotella sp.]|nr:LOG family protein [Bacteroides sp.]MCM1366451.1 LOG family protein [Prevotella sp.]MCM1437069.1 LOG family protein [Prevotella sp.]